MPEDITIREKRLICFAVVILLGIISYLDTKSLTMVLINISLGGLLSYFVIIPLISLPVTKFFNIYISWVRKLTKKHMLESESNKN